MLSKDAGRSQDNAAPLTQSVAADAACRLRGRYLDVAQLGCPGGRRVLDGPAPRKGPRTPTSLHTANGRKVRKRGRRQTTRDGKTLQIVLTQKQLHTTGVPDSRLECRRRPVLGFCHVARPACQNSRGIPQVRRILARSSSIKVAERPATTRIHARERLGPWNAALVAVAVFLALVAAAELIRPTVHETPAGSCGRPVPVPARVARDQPDALGRHRPRLWGDGSAVPRAVAIAAVGRGQIRRGCPSRHTGRGRRVRQSLPQGHVGHQQPRPATTPQRHSRRGKARQ